MNETQLLSHWEIPGPAGGDSHQLDARAGAATVVVGRNGAGKSALGYWLQVNARSEQSVEVRRVIAHRRNWFDAPGPGITAGGREQTSRNMTLWSQSAESRWLDHAQGQRNDIVLFDLMSRIAFRNSLVASAIDSGSTADEARVGVEVSPLTRINSILERAQLPVTIELTQSGAFDAVSKRTGARYPITQMSDGEKSALLLAAELLLAPASCILIVDEPERHLHRAISAGLIEAILAERPDCHFVVLTHDLELASGLTSDSVQTVVLLESFWAAGSPDAPSGWSLRSLATDNSLPDEVRSAILGGKRKLLFIEGESHSLDSRMYRLLFPEWGLNAVGGCEQVIRAVSGLNASTAHHWVDGRGIVDRDGRDESETSALRNKQILVLAVHEIESLYFVPTLIRTAAQKQADMHEGDPDELFDRAIGEALIALAEADTPTRLTAALAAQVVARKITASVPEAAELAGAGDPTISISIDSPFAELLTEFNDYLAARDLEQLVMRFPTRESRMPAAIAQRLGLASVDKYESLIRSCLREDPELVTHIRELVGKI